LGAYIKIGVNYTSFNQIFDVCFVLGVLKLSQLRDFEESCISRCAYEGIRVVTALLTEVEQAWIDLIDTHFGDRCECGSSAKWLL